MTYSLTCAYEFLPAGMTVRVGRVMDHFGVTKEVGQHVIADDMSIDVDAGQIVAFTGDSGSGKSSLMRTLARQLEEVLWLENITFLKGTVIDQFTGDWAESMALLSACGLGEAYLMLRLPSELSDGQRLRLKLAIGISQSPQWLVMDEFTSSLDRTLAKVIAFNLKKLSSLHHIGVLVATTHEDVIDDLQPDVHLRMRIDGEIEVHNRRAVAATAGLSASAAAADLRGEGEVCDTKKPVAGSASRTSFGSAREPNATGRTLLAGIIDRINSGSRNGSLCCGTAAGRSGSACLPVQR